MNLVKLEDFKRGSSFTSVKEGKKPILNNWINTPQTVKQIYEAKPLGMTGIGFIIDHSRDEIFCIDIDADSKEQREEALKAIGLTEVELEETLTIRSPKEFRSKHLFHSKWRPITKSQFQSLAKKDGEKKSSIFEIFFSGKQVVIFGDYIDEESKEKIGVYQSNQRDIKPFPEDKLRQIINNLETQKLNHQTALDIALIKTSSEIERDFSEEIYKAIGSNPDLIKFDGHWHEFSSSAKKRNNKDCRYIAYSWIFKNQEYARITFIDFIQSGFYQTLKSWNENSFIDWNESDKREFDKQHEFIEQELKQKKKEHDLERIETAKEVYESGKEIQEIPIYFRNKSYSIEDISSIAKHLKQHKGFISYPLYHHETKEFIGIQRIYEDGSKFVLGKTGFFNIGFFENIDLSIIYIVEGLATGLSVYSAVNKPVIVANQANLLSKAVKMARLDYPDSLIVIAADKDENKVGEEKAKQACEWVTGSVFKLPYQKVKEKRESLDFDDLRQLEGVERVKEILEDEKGFVFYQSDRKLKEIIKSKNEWAIKAEKAENIKGKEDHYCHLEVTELLNRVIAFTQIGGKSAFINRQNLESQEGLEVWLKEHLQDKYANEKAFIGFSDKGKAKFSSFFNIWLESNTRKDYKGIVFLPMKEKKDYLNLFQGFKYQPKKTVDTDFFWNHLLEILCSGDNESYIYVKKWLSQIFQKPYELTRTAIVIPNSGQGTGKGFLLDQIAKLLGNYFTALTDIERLGARFNSHVAGKLFINANEAIWGGNKSKEGALKALITDPTHLLELKHKEAITINNYARLFVTSNEDWAVPVGMDDRRFVFLEASSLMKNKPEYFVPMNLKANQEGFLESLMFDLTNEDLEGFNFNLRPKKSFEIAKGHKLASMSLVLAWWNDFVNSCEEWKDVFTRKELRLDFEEWCSKTRKTHVPGVEKFWSELKKYFPEEVDSSMNNRIYLDFRQQRVISNVNHSACLTHINRLLQIEEDILNDSDIPF